MTEDEVDFVAAELAKAGGVSWHPGRERGPLKAVSSRYRDRARLAIAALERFRAGNLDALPTDDTEESLHEMTPNEGSRANSDTPLAVGSTILYRPPGDLRLYPCRIEKIEGSQAYIVPDFKTCTGWVDLDSLASATVVQALKPD